ncbi:hypothetical protein NDU88_005814 [Pleurodeles waltl]|uniref:Uncharacterized protein n=1 Tax=Pleurodeles waltl TaxID=8319 RepID=A0AAV7NSH8_PLEWA|nr:hypothetical protein NDU88_005814 [Pleurodeles waltl]
MQVSLLSPQAPARQGKTRGRNAVGDLPGKRSCSLRGMVKKCTAWPASRRIRWSGGTRPTQRGPERWAGAPRPRKGAQEISPSDQACTIWVGILAQKRTATVGPPRT